MFEGQVHDPQVFIITLQAFHDAPATERGQLANAISDAIIGKRVDLAEVRHALLETGKHELMETLDRLLELIEPYIEEGGVDE